MRRWARIKHNVSKSANSGWLACVMRACGFVRRRRRKVQKAVCSHTNLVKSWALIYSISDAARCCYGSTAFFTPSHGAITGFRCVYVLFHFFFLYAPRIAHVVCGCTRASVAELMLHGRLYDACSTYFTFTFRSMVVFFLVSFRMGNSVFHFSFFALRPDAPSRWLN